MEKKKILIIETDSLVARKYYDFLKNTSWEITLKGNLESFLEALQTDTFDMIIAEESVAPDEVLAILDETGTPLILSTNSAIKNKRTVISRDFSSPDLLNTIGKVSFLKITSNPPEKVTYSEDENPGEDEPVLLEPVFEGLDADAVILAPEKDKIPIRSSWEIPEKKENENEFLSKQQDQKKKNIFDRIDEIDSILTSLGKDISEDGKPSVKSSFKFGNTDNVESETELKTEPYKIEPIENKVPGENEADFLFDDNYNYTDNTSEQKKFESVHQPDINTKLIDDFESILKDKPFIPETDRAEEAEIVERIEIVKEVEPVQEIKNNPSIGDDLIKEEIISWLEKNARKIIKEVVIEQLTKLSGKDD